MSNIFISWSKAKSRDFAIEVKNLLESLNPQLNVFMSEENISAGERVQEKIINKIIECDKININGENFETTFLKCFNLCDSSYTRNALTSFVI